MKKLVFILICVFIFSLVNNNAFALMQISSSSSINNISIELSGDLSFTDRYYNVETQYGSSDGVSVYSTENYALASGKSGFAESIASSNYLLSSYSTELVNEGVSLISAQADQKIIIEGSGTATIDFDYITTFIFFSHQSDTMSFGVAEPYLRMEAYINGIADYNYWIGSGSDYGSVDEYCSNIFYSSSSHHNEGISFDGTLELVFHTEAYIEGAAESSHAPVPEPSTMLLLSFGLAGLISKRKFQGDNRLQFGGFVRLIFS